MSVTEFLHAHDPEDAKAKADKFLEVLTMVMQRMKQISLSPEFEVVEVLVGTLIKEKRMWERRLDQLEAGSGVKGKKTRFGRDESVDSLMRMLNENNMTLEPKSSGSGFDEVFLQDAD